MRRAPSSTAPTLVAYHLQVCLACRCIQGLDMAAYLCPVRFQLPSMALGPSLPFSLLCLIPLAHGPGFCQACHTVLHCVKYRRVRLRVNCAEC